jgi:molecular chaperone HtpG
MKSDRPEEYKKFWAMFGEVLKEGIVADTKNRETLMKLGVFTSSKSGSVSLEDYVANMAEGQKSIYYLAGSSAESLAASPKLEAFSKRGLDVLLFSNPIDEIWVNNAAEFDGHKFVSAAASDIEIEGGETEDGGDKEETKKLEDSGFAWKIKDAIKGLPVGEKIDDVRLSSRLVDSPATFVQKEPLSAQMRSFFKSMGQEMPPEHKVLEINPAHPLVQKISARVEECESGAPEITDWAAVLAGLASIADGEPVENAHDFTRSIEKLLDR